MKLKPSLFLRVLFTGAVLLLSSRSGLAEPIRHEDLGAGSAWAAHLDVTKLRGSALEALLRKETGFDRLVELQQTLDRQMSLDLEAFESVTIFAAGKNSRDTAVLLRGDFKKANLSHSEGAKRKEDYRGHTIYEITKWHRHPVFLARRSQTELAGGTSQQAAHEVLDLLDGRTKSWEPPAANDKVKAQLAAATVTFVLDVERIGKQLQFEAEFTRSLRHAWFLIGSEKEDVKFTTLIHSKDAEGLVLLRQQLQGLMMMLTLQEEAPAGLAEVLRGVAIETQDDWMTLKVSLPQEKAPQFLKTMGGMFQGKSNYGEKRRR